MEAAGPRSPVSLEVVVQFNTIGGHAIDVWRFDARGAEATEIVAAWIVSVDLNDVGLRCCGRNGWHEKQGR